MGAQIFLLPYVDTIFGFTILYIVVTAISAWVMTSSPRISYCGVQIALAFYLVHLQSYKFEISLSIARDRVVGVLVGLFAMWLIFDQLWGHPAADDMRKTFIANLRLLAQLAREPDLGDRRDALRRIYSLGQTINGNFDQVRNLGDAVIFEFGASRAADLALRDRLRQWQSKLRALFLIRGAMLRYRLAVPGFELPPGMEPAQEQFDHELSETLDGMADSLEGNPAPRVAHLDQALARVESDAAAHPAPHLNDFLALCRTETQLALSVGYAVSLLSKLTGKKRG
jgi:multidrug resistance protein MdtO